MKLLSALPVLAAVFALPAAEMRYAAIDQDGDARYSFSELRAHYPTLTISEYRQMDANGDGAISPTEFRAGQDEGLLPAPRDS